MFLINYNSHSQKLSNPTKPEHALCLFPFPHPFWTLAPTQHPLSAEG